jgi:hypothetical protein
MFMKKYPNKDERLMGLPLFETELSASGDGD